MKLSILAVEVCARLDQATELHDRLKTRLAAQGPTETRHEKWKFYGESAEDVRAHLSAIEKGCWDFFDDDARARRDFDMWKKGMTTREGVREGPLGAIGAYRDEPRYMTFTMAFLLVQGSATERMMASVCDVYESALWQKHTFANILGAISTMSFSAVHSDVAYLIPRDTEWALTTQDLAEEKFEYLRPLV